MFKFKFLILTIALSNICQASTVARKVSQAEIKCGNTFEEKLVQINDIKKCGSAIYYIKNCSPDGNNIELNMAANKICKSALKNIANVDLDLKRRMVSRCKAVYCKSKVENSACIADLTICESDTNEFIMQFYLDNDY